MSVSVGQESNDAGMIQRLVDGELVHEARSQWLSGIADDSHVWREVALAFIEKQILDEALGMSKADEQPRAMLETADDSQNSPAFHGSSHCSSSRRKYIASWIAGLAACLLVGFFAGFILQQNSPASAMQSTDQVTSKALLAKTSTVESAEPTPIGLADALSRSAVPVPHEFRRALRKAGYSLSDRQAITNVSLPNGGQIELPVRYVDLEYVGIRTFQ